VVSGGGTVFWHTVGSWINRPGAFPSGVVPVRFFLVSRAWPKPDKPHPEGCLSGGGCDGVVVWELYSGREHLVKQVRKTGGLRVDGVFVLFCISNFLRIIEPGGHALCVSFLVLSIVIN